MNFPNINQNINQNDSQNFVNHYNKPNLNNNSNKKLFEQLKLQYEILSKNDNKKYPNIKNFINTTIQEYYNDISRVRTIPSSIIKSKSSFFNLGLNAVIHVFSFCFCLRMKFKIA